MTARLYRLALSLAAATAAFASGTTAWEMSSYADFIRGKFDGISLSRDGRLTLGPKIDTVFTSDQPVVWAAAEAPDGAIYAATGNRGRVYKIDRAGKSSLLWTAPEPEVFAIAVGKDGARLRRNVARWQGLSHRERHRRRNISRRKRATSGRWRWRPNGALYVGTGDQGKVFRVDSAGKGEVYYETGQSHITGLAVDSQGRLLAGTEPNGILYRISAKDKAFVLYDANLPEIRAIVPMPDGTVYAAALGGSVAKQAQAAAQATQNNNSGDRAGNDHHGFRGRGCVQCRRDQTAGHQAAATRSGRAASDEYLFRGDGHQQRRQIGRVPHQSR